MLPTLTVDRCCETDIVRNNQSKNAAGNDIGVFVSDADALTGWKFVSIVIALRGPSRWDDDGAGTPAAIVTSDAAGNRRLRSTAGPPTMDVIHIELANRLGSFRGSRSPRPSRRWTHVRPSPTRRRIRRPRTLV